MGGGRPVVLIHGWPLSAQAWEPQMEVLQTAGFRVIAYDRRGFGRSDMPESGYDHDTLADDLHDVIEQRGLHNLTRVGHSMGGGEVARHIAGWGESRLRSGVFAAAVPPFLLKTIDNPDGPLRPDALRQMKQALAQDRHAYFDRFSTDFYSANRLLQVSEWQRREAVALCLQATPAAARDRIDSFACRMRGSSTPRCCRSCKRDRWVGRSVPGRGVDWHRRDQNRPTCCGAGQATLRSPDMAAASGGAAHRAGDADRVARIEATRSPSSRCP
ncbi:MAG: alpha/beta fold hydrolase [Leptothrix sp. (in: b-proteobacteria)]